MSSATAVRELSSITRSSAPRSAASLVSAATNPGGAPRSSNEARLVRRWVSARNSASSSAVGGRGSSSRTLAMTPSG